jgi:hypothetical protein
MYNVLTTHINKSLLLLSLSMMMIIVITICDVFFSFNSLIGSGVQLRPLGTAATDWPIVACTRREPATAPLCPPQIPLDRTWSIPGRRGGKPATNRLSYGAAHMTCLIASNKKLILKNVSRVNRLINREVSFITSARTPCWFCIQWS